MMRNVMPLLLAASANEYKKMIFMESRPYGKGGYDAAEIKIGS